MAFLKRNIARTDLPRVTLKQRARALVSKTATILHLPLRRRESAECAGASRRILLMGSLATAAVVPFPAFGNGGGAGEDAAVEAVYLGWRDALAAIRKLTRDYDAARKSMPWWAQGGPEELNSKGEHVGRVTGWPAIQDLAPPPPPGVPSYSARARVPSGFGLTRTRPGWGGGRRW
jgi:hypothetical protein